MFLRPRYCCDHYWRRRHRNTLAVTALIFFIAIAALVHGHIRPARTRPPHAQPPATAHKKPHAARRAPARPPNASPAAAGQDLSWAGFHGIQLPASATAGPRHAGGGLASGFADTPAGALLAAINIGVRTSAQWGPAIFQPTITRQVTGPDQAALLHAEASAYASLRAAAHVRPGQPAGRGYAAEVAWRFDAWTPAVATVDVVSAGPGSNGTTVLAATRIQVLWQRGDWRVLAPPGGNWGSSAAAISSLTGYTIFPGER
jgi:hypothetical protein